VTGPASAVPATRTAGSTRDEQPYRVRDEAEELAAAVEGLTVDDALSAPFLALGTHDEIAAHLPTAQRRWGISYFTVRSIEDFAPVIERLRAVDTA
jgi:hypothetical protein